MFSSLFGTSPIRAHTKSGVHFFSSAVRNSAGRASCGVLNKRNDLTRRIGRSKTCIFGTSIVYNNVLEVCLPSSRTKAWATVSRTASFEDGDIKSSNHQNDTHVWSGKTSSDDDKELIQLVSLLPAVLRQELESHPEFFQLVEVVLDVGRPAVARFPSGDCKLAQGGQTRPQNTSTTRQQQQGGGGGGGGGGDGGKGSGSRGGGSPLSSNKKTPFSRFGEDGGMVVSAEHLRKVVDSVGDFGSDNRAGLTGTLHRVSCMRSRRGDIIGLTLRVGRSVEGSLAMLRDVLLSSPSSSSSSSQSHLGEEEECDEEAGDQSSQPSLLLLGRPGAGKTTAIRDIARLLSLDLTRVMVVDTSNEIGGDGDIPHKGIGRARRMQVPDPAHQHQVMIEAVENHMPEVVVIDEIGTEDEAMAARSIAQRGVRLVATAHGGSLAALLRNPSLVDLVGGVQSVTVGDEEARRRGVSSKSFLERKAPPSFQVAVEMISPSRWDVHLDVAASVDDLLRGREPQVQSRTIGEDGQVCISMVDEIEENSRSYVQKQSFQSGTVVQPIVQEQSAPAPEATCLVYTYAITDSLLEQAVMSLGLEGSVQTTTDIHTATGVIALRSMVSESSGERSWVRSAAAEHKVPIYAIKSDSVEQISKGLRTMLGIHPSHQEGGAETADTFPKFEKRSRVVGSHFDWSEGVVGRRGWSNGRSYDEVQERIQNEKRKTWEEEEEVAQVKQALQEAQIAVETVLISGEVVSLQRYPPFIVAMQANLVATHSLDHVVRNAGPSYWLDIFPKDT